MDTVLLLLLCQTTILLNFITTQIQYHNMQQFFKFVFASCLGVFLAGIALFLFGIIAAAGFAGSAEDTVKTVESNSVLEIKLEEMIPELTGNTQNENIFENKKVVGLTSMLTAIDHAASDDKIKGIFINTRFIMTEFPKVAAIREAIEQFKKSGKFVYAYADFYSQGGYYLASVADSICLNPTGDIDFKGMSAEIPFMKDMFDRLDVIQVKVVQTCQIFPHLQTVLVAHFV